MIQIVRRSIVDVYNRYSFNRQSLAYDSKGRLYHLHNARFEPGKFGKAVLVEEGTTNLITKDFDEWGNNGLYLELIKNGDWDYTLKRTNDMNSFLSFDIPCTPNTTYCFSIEQLIDSDMDSIFIYQRGVQSATESNRLNIKSPGKYSNTFTTGEDDTVLRVYIHCGSSGEAGQQARIRLPQLEKLPYPTTFVNGTRAAETLTIPTAGVLNPQEGTVECWVYIDGDIASQSPQHQNWIFAHATSDELPYPNALGFRRTKGVEGVNRWDAWTGDGSGNKTILFVNWEPIRGWHYFAMRWSPSELAFFIDGVKRGSVLKPYLPTSLAPNAYIGSWVTASPSSKLHVNTLIDDLRISNRARTDEEIAAAYASGQPLPVDGYTTLKLDFDGPDAQRVAKVLVV